MDNGQQPTANSQQPTANSQQPTANSQQPTANSQQPTAQQAMQAPRRSSLAVDVADPAGALLPCLCGHAHCAFA
ncbi:hypothetical protein XAR_2066 [Xanthomonas citri pv. glycines str. 8ra]|nr:hypothetical protein XAR_2066 [Xanthomonas citri pv. glycines str. 8ra]